MIKRTFGMLGIVFLVASSYAQVNFSFNTVHSGGTPSGTPSWAQMTLTDVSGGVNILITHLANAPSESGRFVRELYLKFNTLPTGYSFSSSPYITGISLGNYINAGLPFNVQVDFKVSPPSQRFLQGNSTSFTLFGVSAADFAGMNNSGMVHIQGLFGGESSKVIAPEPASLIAMGTGLAGLLGIRRRKR
ncbi:MAG: PEP-CTERM sorting domain-containing protein [Fimbriimonadales bacterium]